MDVKLKVSLKVGDGTIYPPGQIFKGSFSSLPEDVRDLVKKNSPVIVITKAAKTKTKSKPNPEEDHGPDEADGPEVVGDPAKEKTNKKLLKTRP